jgi:LPS-assembly protein
MYRLLYLSLIFINLLFGKETIEIFAKNVVAKDNSVYAYDSVILLYDGGLIKSNSAFYDKNASLLTLKGKVEMIGFEDNVLSSDKIIINTANKSVNIDKVFLSGEEDLWIDATKAEKKLDRYKLFNSRISSCNKVNPDWTIEFEEADYRLDKKFITMKNAKLRFYDTTIFYLPYLALPTLNERTTGFLFPNFKLSSDREGFLYEQPFFYAPTNSWDVEFAPQIRTKRGFGSYVTTRFVDSNHSEGLVRVGYFKNGDDYVRRNSINQEHWGTELFYKSTNFLPTAGKLDDYKSAFYFNGTYLNDREYLSLQKDSLSSLVSSNLVESRLNSFLYNEENYFGLYGRYNIDTSKSDNYNTIQDIPSLHYHHYMKQIRDSKLFYTIDARLHNYTRVKGSRASQLEADIPLTYYESFFDDFLNLSLSENLYLSRVDFRNLTVEDDEYYYYYRNYHTVNLSSDLSKRYGDLVHILSPSLTYIRPSLEKESTLYRDLKDEKKQLFVTQTQEEQLSLALSQHYYKDDLDMRLFQRFGYTSYPERVESRGDFTNEMGYNNEKLSLYSNLTYAWNEKQVRSLLSSIGYNQSNYDIMLTHFYNHDFLYDNKETSFLQSQFVHRYSDNNSWFINFDYDLEQLYNHQWKVGWTQKKKCWSARVSLGQEVIPNVDNSFRNTALYFQLNLNPIGGIERNIEENFSSQGNR